MPNLVLRSFKQTRAVVAAILLAAAFASIAVLAATARAATTNTNCAGLQAALNTAANGDTVVLNGLCTNVGGFTLPSGVAFTLEGASGTTSGFDGTTMTASELNGSGLGGVTLSNLTFENFDASSQAVSLTETANQTLTLDSDTFANNTAVGTTGNNYAVVAIGISGGTTSCTSQAGALTVENSKFTNNSSTNVNHAQGAFGGALAVFVKCGADPVTLTGNTFAGNTLETPAATWQAVGAGFYIDSQGTAAVAPLTQSGNTFTGNTITSSSAPSTSPVEGAGEFVENMALQSTNDVFAANTLPATAIGEAASGAGLMLTGVTQCYTNTLNNDIIAANEVVGSGPTADFGAGMYIGGCATSPALGLTLNDSTVSDNSLSPALAGGTAGIYGSSADTLTLHNSIVAGNQGGDQLDGFNSGGGSITATYSDFCNGVSPYTGTGNICAPPLLADAGNPTSGDVHETAASPTLDAGSNLLVPGSVTADPYGVTRKLSATACPIAAGTVDIGAAEYAPSPCAVPGTAAAPIATAGTGSATVSFTAPAANGSPISSYTVTASPGGAHATGTASPLTVTGLTAGQSYTFTVTATNALGSSPASPASNAVTPSAPTGPTGPTPTPPALSGLKASTISFFAARSGGSITTRKGVGTKLTYTDSEAATATLSFYRVFGGYKHNGVCRPPSSGFRGKPCSRFKLAGSFTNQDVAGKNKIHFSGRLGGHALPAGLYQVRITASSGGVSGNTVKAEFDVF